MINWHCGDHDWYRRRKVCPHIIFEGLHWHATQSMHLQCWPRLPSVRCARPPQSRPIASKIPVGFFILITCNSTPLICILSKHQLAMWWSRLVLEAQGLSTHHIRRTPLTCNPKRAFAIWWPRLPSVRCTRSAQSHPIASKTLLGFSILWFANPLICIPSMHPLAMRWSWPVSEAQGLSNCAHFICPSTLLMCTPSVHLQYDGH